mmetsp:Transcript_35006/g.25484  ORF Transcript_35006/g.25484 Transcript_35006/m.25484 type:complete len:92 (-) Transcript_35006:481-756(-)
MFSNCTEDYLVENLEVHYGLGMSIGSVTPNDDYNCVRNITFRNIDFHHPFKSVYIKTNPGEDGYGEISNIVYENLNIVNPLWWNIYVGPQQ